MFTNIIGGQQVSTC